MIMWIQAADVRSSSFSMISLAASAGNSRPVSTLISGAGISASRSANWCDNSFSISGEASLPCAVRSHDLRANASRLSQGKLLHAFPDHALMRWEGNAENLETLDVRERLGRVWRNELQDCGLYIAADKSVERTSVAH